MCYVISMLEELLKEKAQIIKSFEGTTLSDIYEERYNDILRLYEIDDEIQNIKRETHCV